MIREFFSTKLFIFSFSRRILLVGALSNIILISNAQEVYQHISHKAIYDFIDELANEQLISINSAVKPYSRKVIAEKLNEVLSKKDSLNKRQLADLDFYLKDYNKELMPDKKFDKRYDLFYYKDSLFTVSVNPILGIDYYSNDSGSFYHRWNGAEIFSYVGKNLGMYASLRDNHEDKVLSDPSYINLYQGANYKRDQQGGGDYSEMRGGITYSWKWGSVGAVKDHFAWGDNEHGAIIFSGRTPSFAHLKLNVHPVPWFDFNYVHGWLVSEVIDSANIFYTVSGSVNRLSFHPKYLAANMLTVTPLKNLDVSVGNSVLYSDQNINPAYLIPVFFYKSVDHTYTGTGADELGQNAQMFFNISSRQLKNIHVYISGFIDEIEFGTVWDAEKQSNFISGKLGARLSNFIVHNLFITGEYTRTNPITYRHWLETATFASNNYNLGNYLGDNSQEGFLSIGYKPITKLLAEVSYNKAQKGAEYEYNGHSGTSGSGKGDPFMKKVYWQSEIISARAQYQILNDCYLSASVIASDIHGISDEITRLYTQPFFIGKKTTINFGVNVGF